MANTVLPVLLNIGLDTVTPPLMAKEGSLIDCLNYELTDATGYRRIDGYENYDGFPNGSIDEYYRIQVATSDPLEQDFLVPNTVIYRSDFGLNPVAIGVILSTQYPNNFYDVSPMRSADSFILIEEFLVQTDGESFINLNSEDGFLRIIGDGTVSGSTFTAYTPDGGQYDLTITGELEPGQGLIPATEYLDNLRAYSEALRNSVTSAPGAIAGLYWFNDRLLAAVNSINIDIVIPTTDPAPIRNMIFRIHGVKYRTLEIVSSEIGTDTQYTLHLQPYGTDATVDDDLVEIAYDGTVIKTWKVGIDEASVNSDNSTTAYLGYFPDTSLATERGFVILPLSYNTTYTLGTHSSAFGPPVTLDEDSMYYAVGSDGAVLKVRLTSLSQSSGTFTGNDSAGSAQFSVVEVLAGNRDYLLSGDEIHTEYPTTGASRVMTTDSEATPGYIAGTGALDAARTRYQWISANFYAHSEGAAAYGATGASTAFWANENGWGTISTGLPIDTDTPKYVAFHAGRLALGYRRGSVLMSVAGDPANWRGEDGAVEIATGDTITGLLEMPGETLAVFGLRSIRKITGTTDSDLHLGTISGSSGCFDYTAVLVGQDAVFTGVNGISTLQQTAAYGDFAGQRMSDSIANWLRPRLSSGFESLQRGGAVMAYPVRGKNQYRLVLTGGNVVILTLTAEGPKITLGNWGLSGNIQVPYAWSSSTDHQGKERIHVSWESRTRSSRVIELESGWGFNGRTFRHYFDTAHVFAEGGASYLGIEKVRMYGQGHGAATLDVKSAGVETDFEQPYHDAVQDISMPILIETIYNRMRPVTSITDQANWGLGIKLRFRGTMNEGSTLTEPPHICQALVLHVRAEGAADT